MWKTVLTRPQFILYLWSLSSAANGQLAEEEEMNKVINMINPSSKVPGVSLLIGMYRK
ncbi:hypothetical protein DFO73_105118 [Cytobacillus oceanisediminis]|jgi:hypothetical protein|uniref:Uncharacterized protein n=1 Tax=Cytobacillus oceanisediminis TaxID=665099 RepID=A0A2V2ZZL7_9BACI|nr:hypothetical protein DFO73_105118 [Cytobacillus oceanisediminis]